MSMSAEGGLVRAVTRTPFLMVAALELAWGVACSSSSTAGGADAAPSKVTADASDAATNQDAATSGCTSIDFGQETIVCSEPVACGEDAGPLPPCTWAAALAFVCPLVSNSPGYTFAVETCNGGLNAWTSNGIDSGGTVYYSALTGQIVADIGGGAPGVGTCQAPCDFVVPALPTADGPGGCTVDNSPCGHFPEAGVVDASMDGSAADAQPLDAARDAPGE
jgi:hypothetical protein